ncbi:hypothetical protein LOK49_LG08G01724 [Camellia lanceoleosa]|uniref:Uncharacterized protein n=1 Tax=Camellia lanceoleosa TaxID=1840588 RepID=A0ACC0GXW6_9ERIC|nr:hypothetical protein LOK49_LG08G01724 [Camellia lanceoleosa]
MEIEEDVKDFKTIFEKANKGLQVWRFRRSELRQEMKDMCEIVLKLLEESNQSGEYLVIDHQNLREVMSTTNPKISTFEMHVDNILNLLRNDKVKGIRIRGMVGSGKMTIMPSLNNHKEVGEMFDIVVWVKVSMKDFKDLEVFDFRGSGVKSIPSFIEKLMCLRRLLVSFADNKFSRVASNCKLISKLSALKELIIDVNAPREQWSVEMLNATIEKIVLVKLTTLQFQFLDETVDIIKLEASTTYICVPNANILRIFMKRDDLCFASFQVCIGCHSTCPRIPMSYQYERYMKCESFNPTVSELLAKADAFELVNFRAENLMKFFTSMDQVRGLLIESCNAIGTIVDGNSTKNSPVLPNLERLYIKNMPKLKSILEGYLPFGSLRKIKTLVWQRNEDKEHFQQHSNFRIMSTTANTVEGTNRIVEEAPRDVSQETPSGPAASKKRLLEADKGKAVASSGNGKRVRVDQTSGVPCGISIREPVGVAVGVFSVGSGGLRQWVLFLAVAMESPRQRRACWWRGQQLRSCSSLGSSSGESCSSGRRLGVGCCQRGGVVLC